MKLTHTSFDANKIQIGVSACLLGQPVRYDGGHKRSAFVDQSLREFAHFVPVCPEVAIGMGTPRPTIRLVEHDSKLSVQSSHASKKTGELIDVTQDLSRFSQQQASHLKGLSGFIFCAKSPSCGTERIKVYDRSGRTIRNNEQGVFAKAIREKHPLLPVEDSGRLCDPVLRENFITRVYAWHQWQMMCAEEISVHKLTQFHARYKFLVMAHSPQAYRKLGRLLGQMEVQSVSEIAEKYIHGLMEALSLRANRRGHTNVLMHLQGYFKRYIDSGLRVALSNVIQQYRAGELPLMAPITLIKHLLVAHPNDYLSQQVYLNPHPDKLALRSPL